MARVMGGAADGVVVVAAIVFVVSIVVETTPVLVVAGTDDVVAGAGVRRDDRAGRARVQPPPKRSGKFSTTHVVKRSDGFGVTGWRRLRTALGVEANDLK